MIATREQQKAKALELMEKLGLPELYQKCVEGNPDFVGEYFAWELEYPELSVLIKNLETLNGFYVYYVTHSYSCFGECYSLLCVSKYLDDFQHTDVRETKNGDKVVWAYVENISYPERSEFGSITVRKKTDGFLVRVA